MKLTKKEFNEGLADKKLTIALIGMSGMGKSHRSIQLQSLGFQTYGCDDEIAKKIPHHLPTADVSGVASWMGYPYTSGYEEREGEYLQLENQVTQEGITGSTTNKVLDTTGSVIYLSEAVLQDLRQNTLVVYLESSPKLREKLFQLFIQEPKPIIWGDVFNQKEAESEMEALKRCYPELLEFRASRYRALADVVLPFDIARDERSTGQEFLEVIARHL